MFVSVDAVTNDAGGHHIGRSKRSGARNTFPTGVRSAPVSGHSGLIDLQQRIGNRSFSRLVQRAEGPKPAQQQNPMLEQSRALIEQGLSLASTAVALSAPAARSALQAPLTAAGELLDAGIELYRRSGGRLGDIDPENQLLELRAQLSAALFYLTAGVATQSPGWTPLGMLLGSHLQMAEDAYERVRLDAWEGSAPGQEEPSERRIPDEVLVDRYLAPFGSRPTVIPRSLPGRAAENEQPGLVE